MIDAEGNFQNVTPGNPLPDKPFVLIQVNLHPRKEWTDAQMAELGRLPGLMNSFQISSTSVGDEGIGHLARMSVAGVDCGYTRLTDAGVARLMDNTALRGFNADLPDVPLSAGTMAKVAALPRLRAIHGIQGGTDVSPLGQSRSLVSLVLSLHRSDTVGLAALKGVASFQSFSTWAGLIEAEADALAAIPSLRQVAVHKDVESSAAAIARLRTARPDLLIVHPGAKIDAAQRDAYRWVREAGGKLTGYTPPADAPDRLPDEAFSSGSLQLGQERPIPARSDAIRGLRGLYEVRARQFEDLDEFVDNLVTVDTVTQVTLDAPQLSAKKFKTLCELPQLELLVFDGTAPALTDDDLAPLAKSRWLNFFSMGNSAIGDAGLAHLAKCEQLETLRLLYAKNLTGAGLARFASHRWLWNLNLSGSNISDDALEGIAQIQSLRCLWLRDTQCTPAGIARLKGFLPHCTIFHNGGLELPEPLPSK
jgi:hypothetical protein